MPNVAGREFSYTPEGRAAADRYRQSQGMRYGGMMGFRPLGYAKGGDVRNLGRIQGDVGLSNQDLAMAQRRESPGAGVAPEPFSYDSESKAAVIEYIMSLTGMQNPSLLLDLSDEQLRAVRAKVEKDALAREMQQMQQMQQMPSPLDKDIEQFSQIAAPVPILPPGTGDYEMREDPNIATTPAVRDAYYGGGIPGPSFVPTGDQTAPDFRGYAGGGMMGFRPLGYQKGGDVAAVNDDMYNKFQEALNNMNAQWLNHFLYNNKDALARMAEADPTRQEELTRILKLQATLTPGQMKESPPHRKNQEFRDAIAAEQSRQFGSPNPSVTYQHDLEAPPPPGSNRDVERLLQREFEDAADAEVDIYRNIPGVDRETGDYYPPSERRHGGIMSIGRR